MPEDNPLASRIHRSLRALEVRGLARQMHPPSGIDLSSNDYLNLACEPRVREAFRAALAREGCGSTGSRLLRGDRSAFGAVEDRFAAFKGSARSLFFSSGYLANLAVLTCLTEEGDVIFSDARNHASIVDGCRLSRARVVIAPHNDVEALSDLIDGASCAGIRFVVVESVYSMDGDASPLAEYAALCRKVNAVLVVDEAHAVGVCGERGTGQIERHGLDHESCLSINTAGKALGVGGAFVAGPSWVIEYLVQRARPFIYSTAPPPAMAEALQASLSIVEMEPDRRDRVRARARLLRARLHESGLDVALGDSHIVPIVIGDNDRAVAVARAVQAEGFDVRAIRPPSVPEGTARLRVSVNAGLEEASLERFVQVLIGALRAQAAVPGD
jgi:8-amino-7-oxononanoate synthase